MMASFSVLGRSEISHEAIDNEAGDTTAENPLAQFFSGQNAQKHIARNQITLHTGSARKRQKTPLADISNKISEPAEEKDMISKVPDAISFMRNFQEKKDSDHVCCKKRCLLLLNYETIYKNRQQFKSLSLEKQREWILHFLHTVPATGDICFFLGGTRICQAAWQFIFGISNWRFYSLRKDFLLHGRVTGESSHWGTKSESEAVARARSWLETFVEESGDDAPDERRQYLPSCYTKCDIFQSYLSDMKISGLRDQDLVGSSCFANIWNRFFPNVSIAPRNKFTKCGICTLIKELNKECKTQTTKKEIKLLKECHNDLQRAERRVYYRHRDKARANPDKYLSLILDGMDQSKTNIPHYTTDTKGHRIHFYKTHVTGVLSHGQRTSFQYIDCLEWSHDADLTINLLFRSLVGFSKDGKLPSVLYLQMDNCWRENKNIYVFAACALLIKMRIFKKIRLSFLMVGHTHEDIDQLFSHISFKLNKNKAVTLPALTKCIEEAYDMPHKVEQLKYMYAIKDWLLPFMNNMTQHSRPHAFKFEHSEDGEVGMMYKNWSSEGSWNGDQNQKPLIILTDIPTGAPSLLRATCAHQHGLDQVKTGATHCKDRFTLLEREWWDTFLQKEEAKQKMWESMTDKELEEDGRIGWYLGKLEQYQERSTPEVEPESLDVQAKKRAIEKLYDKENAFKQVTVRKRRLPKD